MSGLAKKHYKVSGLIIGKRNFLETDKIIYILTQEKGIIQVNVKGARKPKSKLTGSTELFVYGDFEVVKGRNLDILTSAKSYSYFENAANSLNRISNLYIICEVLQKLFPEAVPNPKIFSETLNVFKYLDTEESSVDTTNLYLYKLIVLLGYGLNLDRCFVCKNTLSPEVNFLSFEDGSVLCKNCAVKTSTRPISPEEIKVLRFIETSDFVKYSKIKIPTNTQESISRIISKYLDYIYQREFKTRRFAKDLKELPKQVKK